MQKPPRTTSDSTRNLKAEEQQTRRIHFLLTWKNKIQIPSVRTLSIQRRNRCWVLQQRSKFNIQAGNHLLYTPHPPPYPVPTRFIKTWAECPKMMKKNVPKLCPKINLWHFFQSAKKVPCYTLASKNANLHEKVQYWNPKGGFGCCFGSHGTSKNFRNFRGVMK